jgi:hypothetical protein
MTFGIDLSHHNPPARVPWQKLSEQPGAFAICRATYGTMADRFLVEHVRDARAHEVRVGLYAFFRISQPVADQVAAFRKQAAACDYELGDICPWLDIELDPLPKAQKVAPSWSGPAFEFASALRECFGACGIYITQADWHALGKPGWVLDLPIWVAHWTGAAKPATPGGVAYAAWQYRVGPFDPKGAGGYDKARPELDQNRAVEPLPVVTRLPGVSPLSPPADAGDDPELDELLDRAMVALQERNAELVGDLVREGIDELSQSDEPPDTIRDTPASRDPGRS